ncbi:hypothetical protein RHGRI_007288 [Rhododendron griersonianum]|uniref:DOG1 domain-containing protein n=1 Tax=Rhododendron griersonianum TaxID=479676 RepID=A0AAV6KXM9_9ERIC|nr:hypothetical protein RHGRI_007288 [Rhododendron griersonianum]
METEPSSVDIVVSASPLCYSCSLGVTSYYSSRFLSLSASKAAALPSSLFAPAMLSPVSASSKDRRALAFDIDYARWLDEHQRLINDLRSAVNSHMGDNDLRVLVDAVMSHYDEIFRLKGVGAKSDVFHMLSGMCKTPAERCFLWLGGFCSSELLKILGNHLEPLMDQQLMGICNLQQSSQQAEDALSQGMEALQQSLVETLSSNCLGPTGSGNVADYMGQMAIAMGKLATLENFLHKRLPRSLHEHFKADGSSSWVILRLGLKAWPVEIVDRPNGHWQDLPPPSGGLRTACLPSTLTPHNTVVKFVYFNVYAPEFRCDIETRLKHVFRILALEQMVVKMANRTWIVPIEDMRLNVDAFNEFVASLHVQFLNHVMVVLLPTFEFRVIVFDGRYDNERIYDWFFNPVIYSSFGTLCSPASR